MRKPPERAPPEMPAGLSIGGHLTVDEAAALAGVPRKRVMGWIARRALTRGVHFIQPRGLTPRILREPYERWLDRFGRPPRLPRREPVFGRLNPALVPPPDDPLPWDHFSLRRLGRLDELPPEPLRSIPPPIGHGHEYLLTAEVAALAGTTPQRLRNLRRAGVLLDGLHVTRPPHMRLRWRRSMIEAWLAGVDEVLFEEAWRAGWQPPLPPRRTKR